MNALRYSDPDESVLTVAEPLPQHGIDLVSFDRIRAVAAIALDADITVVETAYVSLAEQLDAPCYTADKWLLDALERSGEDRLLHVRTY